MDVHRNVELLRSLCCDISAVPLSEVLNFILLYAPEGADPAIIVLKVTLNKLSYLPTTSQALISMHGNIFVVFFYHFNTR